MITMDVSQGICALMTDLPFLEQLDQPIGVDVYLYDVTAKEGEDEGHGISNIIIHRSGDARVPWAPRHLRDTVILIRI
jgi:hypothetical protein